MRMVLGGWGREAFRIFSMASDALLSAERRFGSSAIFAVML